MPLRQGPLVELVLSLTPRTQHAGERHVRAVQWQLVTGGAFHKARDHEVLGTKALEEVISCT